MQFDNMKRNLLIGAAAVTVAGGVAVAGASLAPQIVSAASTSVVAAMPGGHERDFGGRGLFGHRDGDHAQYLAEALGTTIDELQTAIDAARVALQPENGDGRGFARGDRDALRDEMQAALAGELGITVEELDAAMDAAKEAALAEAVANGDITQEQADLMQAGQAIKEYVDRDALAAAALGMSVDELQAARDEGITMDELLDQQGLDRVAFADALKAEADKALDQAVADGIITQEQADQLREMGGRFMDGGRAGHGERSGSRSFDDENGPWGGPRGHHDHDGRRGGPRDDDGSSAPQDGTSGTGTQSQGDSQLSLLSL